MTPSRRAALLGAAAAAALAAGPGAWAAGDKFSISGKKGPFLKQIASRHFDTGGGARGSMGLASDAVNLGQYQAARLSMPQTSAKVAQLVNGLDAHWAYAKPQALQVHILGIDFYNAYSLPDGSIVVGFGLLDQAKSDDEVAFVLAHELGHLRLGHFAQMAAAQKKAQAKRKLASSLGQLYTVSAAFSSGGASGAVSAVERGAATQAGATNDLMHFLVGCTAEPGHTREQEDEADCVGYDLTQAANYSADAASARVFDSIQADQDKRAAETDKLDASLKDKLGTAVSPSTASSFLGGGGGGGTMGLVRGVGRLALGVATAGAASGGGEGAPQHRPPEERKRGVAQYSTDAYPDGAPLRDEQHAWLDQVRATPEYAQAKICVDAIYDAKRARAEGDYSTAGRSIAKALRTTYKDAPLVLNEAARLRDDMGDAPGSDRLFMQAHLSPDQTVDGYLDHARMLYRTRQNERCVAVINQGTQRFNNDNKPFLSLLIAVARQGGRDDEALRYLATCNAQDDEALKKDCLLAAGPLGGAQQTGGQQNGQQQSRPRPSLPFGIPHL